MISSRAFIAARRVGALNTSIVPSSMFRGEYYATIGMCVAYFVLIFVFYISPSFAVQLLKAMSTQSDASDTKKTDGKSYLSLNLDIVYMLFDV